MGVQAQTMRVVRVPQTVPGGCLAPDHLHFGTLANSCSKKGLWMWGEVFQWGGGYGAVVMGQWLDQVMGLGACKPGLVVLAVDALAGLRGYPKNQSPHAVRRAAQQPWGEIRGLRAFGSV